MIPYRRYRGYSTGITVDEYIAIAMLAGCVAACILIIAMVAL